MRRPVAFLLVLLLVLSSAVTCHATEPVDIEETSEHEETTEYPNDTSREPDIVSKAAIVMDAETGQILYEKNSDVGKYPASITKIMTVMLALEHDVDMNEVVTMSENAIWGIERSSTNIGLDVGEQITVRDLLYATMVKSANECAYALAELVAGDVESFADLMNEKAAELGCKHTHFVTPNGLHDDDHYTTAYDMALIMRAAIQNPDFRKIAGTVNYTVPATNLTDETRPLWTGTKMINPAEPYYYEYCEGGKNGYTTNANNTLVTFASKDGLELICVILDCDGQKYAYTDTRALYNYCYNNYMYFYPLSDFSFTKDTNNNENPNLILNNYYDSLSHELINLTVDKNYCILIHKTTDTTQIEKEIVLYDKASGNTLGEINFSYNGNIIGSAPITSSTPSLSPKNEEQDSPETKSFHFSKRILLSIIIVFASLIIVFVLYIATRSIIQTRKQNERRRRYTTYQKRKRRKHRNDDYHF